MDADSRTFASYDEAMGYLFTLTNYERGIVHKPRTTPKLGLERIARLLEFVGNPERRLRAVHIAGTKGKGSTATMAANALTQAGYKTGLFVSPHVEHVRERIQIDGRWIPEEAVREHVNGMYDYLRRSETRQDGIYKPTFFEVFTTVAFMHFAAEAVDFAVVEVGMGGRLDTTNVLQPLVCGITPVSMDHTEVLGPTLAAIAGEKAGIIKPGVPVICGRQQPEALAVIRDACRERNAPLHVLDEDIAIESSEKSFAVRTWAGSVEGISLRMPGEHQVTNAATAAGLLLSLRERGHAVLTDEQIAGGLSSAFCPARVEMVRSRPATVVDSAHNPASIRALLATLRTSFRFERLVCVVAIARDKDVATMLRLICSDAQYVVFTRMNNPRACLPEELAEAAGKLGVASVTTRPDIGSAIAAAEAFAREDDLICVCGSFYLAGDARALLAGPAVQQNTELA